MRRRFLSRQISRFRSARTSASLKSTRKPATSACMKYVAVDDCGNVLNPLLVEGQVHGGIVQAFGQAMLEEAVYDEQGQLITGELTDYAIPRAADMPWMETDRTVTPSPVNPLGVKGVGEAGTIGATPALANAVADALVSVRRAPRGHAVQARTNLEAHAKGQQEGKMIPAPFEYAAPKTLEEALRLVERHGDEAKILAGGHSLLPLMKLRLAQPRYVIDIGRLRGMSYIREENGHIAIGALTTHAEIESSSLLRAKCPLLAGNRRGHRRRSSAQPRHARRKPGPCRSRRGLSRRGSGAGRGNRCRVHSRDANDSGE